MFFRNHNVLDCSRACTATCEKQNIIALVFDRCNIQRSKYVVHAGFDESLIKSSVGYLEQVHVFVSKEVDATSPLLSELGRIFSPFSSILFTESSSYHLLVFKDDGNVWEFDELVYFTASKFADGGASANMPLVVISLSQTYSLGDGATSFSQGGSGRGEGEKNKKQKSNKGKERNRGYEGKGNRMTKILITTQKTRQELEMEPLLPSLRKFPSKLPPRYTRFKMNRTPFKLSPFMVAWPSRYFLIVTRL